MHTRSDKLNPPGGQPVPVVSVVVSANASENLLQSCREQLARQTIHDRCEIIVLAENSSQARAEALARARGRYWINIATENCLQDNALETFTAALDRHADCAMAYSDAVWSAQPNDSFPPAAPIKTVKYQPYTPIQTLFYQVPVGLQFWRTESLRKLNALENVALDADSAMLRMMEARMNAVHVSEPLISIYQKNDEAIATYELARNDHRSRLDIGNIFKVDRKNPSSAADAWAVLGHYATRFSIPGQEKATPDFDFAIACFHKALELDPQNLAGGMNLVVASYQTKRLEAGEAELVRRWPKMQDWIAMFSMGEGVHVPLVTHALRGPVYRPAEWKNRPTAQQLAQEPAALRPWIHRIDGRHVYLSEDIFPQPGGFSYKPEELQAAAKQLALAISSMPKFYAHFGGAGDALLLLASFYDQSPEAVIFSYPNSVGATRAFFEAFPKLSKIYFLPSHADSFFHVVLRFAVISQLRNCLGAGTTPVDSYDIEWKAGIDIEKKYKINKSPRWAAAFRQNSGSKQVAIAPKGSLSGMVGSKRNIIAPEIWPDVIAHIQTRGFEPVILGMANEAQEYPALPGCIDRRKESFAGQMQCIGRCAGVVGADSWAKTFSGLAEIPTLVFDPLKSAELIAWNDPSDWIFMLPWPAIKAVHSLAEFRTEFDSRIAGIAPITKYDHSKAIIAWEGSYLDCGSLSNINRELTGRLARELNIARVNTVTQPAKAAADPAMQQLVRSLQSKGPVHTAVTVRHQWPPNWSKPASGKLVIIQPWEYGALPKAWVDEAANVDEFWVPSPTVRAMYADSGIPLEKVRLVPNGVDTKKFRPGLTPLPLPTKKKFKFLFVGGTIYRKGPDILLEAFTRAFTAADNVALVIKDFGGDSFYRGQTAGEAIRAIQAKPGAPEIIHLTEEIAAEKMPSLYAACDCLVLPYRGEGFGMPVLEAMACGLPVIVTSGGATDSFVTPNAGWKIPSRLLRLNDRVGNIPLVKNGYLLDPSTPHLITILKQAAAHPAECRQRGANGREQAEKRFDWADISALVLHQLREFAEDSGVQAMPGEIPQRPVKIEAQSATIPAVAQVGELTVGRDLLAQKKFSMAWIAAMDAVAHRPFHPEGYLLLANIAAAAGDATSARQCAQHARALVPGWKPAKQFLNQPVSGNTKSGWLQLPADNKNSLSVCLIVKNEEKFLEQCLKSIRGLANQIVLVDTGSTDRTVEIAREFGAEVHTFTWCDDFAAARNAALEHATGDWILMLDADEELPAEQQAQLRADLKKPDALAFRLPLINREHEAEGASYVPRLFRNVPGAFYAGRVHEQVFPSLVPLSKAWGLKIGFGTAQLLHHGYTKEMVRDRNKVERNLELLRQAVIERPADANLMMNYGLELVRSGDLNGGVEKYAQAFDLMSALSKDEIAEELRDVLLTQYTCQLYKLQAHQDVVRVLNSPLAKVGGLTASLHFALGLALFELKQFAVAVEQMRACIRRRHEPVRSPINTDILTCAPEHCLALSLAKTGDAAGAERAFQAAMAGKGKIDDVKLDYARFLAGQNRAVEAFHKFNELVAANSRNVAAWRAGGEIALSRHEFLEFARDWTQEAMRYAAEDFIVSHQRAEALLLNGDAATSAEIWERLWNSERQPMILGALILCELVGSKVKHGPDNVVDEPAASRAFIKWYQKLVTMRAYGEVKEINGQLEELSRVLPTAAGMLEKALKQTQVVAV